MIYTCTICNRTFTNSQALNGHKSHHHSPRFGRKAWNKGLSKETDQRVLEYSIKSSQTLTGKVYQPWSEEQRRKLSESMKKAHKEGRAWNIGMSRWNNEPSYPEKFFMKVISNSFNDKNYIREHPIGKYSADFAWIHKKKIIEIDGKQHEDTVYKERDKRKDAYIKSIHWQVLRIKWIDLFNNTKEIIKMCKDWIDMGL